MPFLFPKFLLGLKACKHNFILFLVYGILAVFEVHGQQVAAVNLVADTAILKVQIKQGISFGNFSVGNTGGKISISSIGSRQSEGSVVPLNFGGNFTALVLEIEGHQGVIVNLMANEAILTGSNGGKMKLRLKEMSPPMPFVLQNESPLKNTVTVGAELIVGNALESPPGAYSGQINISVISE